MTTERKFALDAENHALREALGAMISLYDTDEGCRTLSQYISAKTALSATPTEPSDVVRLAVEAYKSIRFGLLENEEQWRKLLSAYENLSLSSKAWLESVQKEAGQ